MSTRSRRRPRSSTRSIPSLFFDDEIQGFNTDAPGTAIALETFTDDAHRGRARVDLWHGRVGTRGRVRPFGARRGAGDLRGAIAWRRARWCSNAFSTRSRSRRSIIVRMGGVEDIVPRRERLPRRRHRDQRHPGGNGGGRIGRSDRQTRRGSRPRRHSSTSSTTRARHRSSKPRGGPARGRSAASPCWWRRRRRASASGPTTAST